MADSGLVWLNIHGKVVGPLSVDVVRAKMARGELRPGTRWSPDRATWRDLTLFPANMPGPGSVPHIPTLETPASTRTASPPYDPDLPPPIPPSPWLPRALALGLTGLAMAALLVTGTLFVARPDLFGTMKNTDTVAQVYENGPAWGAEEAPAPQPGKGPDDKKAPDALNDPAKAANPGQDNPAEAAKPADEKPEPMPAQPPPKADGKPDVKPEIKPEMKVEDVVRKCEPSVAVLRNAKGSGSGFLVEPNLIATNHHVVGDVGNQTVIRFPSAPGLKEREFRGTVVRADEVRDLALVRLREIPGPPPLDLGDEKALNKGQDIIVIGSPGLGNADVIENAVRKGTFSTTKDLPPFGEVLELGVAINPGNSGGPVFDLTGKVIGVAVAKGAMVEAVGFAVPVSQLREMVRKQRTGAR
jgi:serine protease Do